MKLSPQHWTWRSFVGVGLFLGAVNLFGPMGLMHWGQLAQEQGRLQREENNLREQIARVRSDMDRFRRSAVFRERMLREELGLLKPDEVSVEFR